MTTTLHWAIVASLAAGSLLCLLALAYVTITGKWPWEE